jgi:nitrogen PTS system EIIA component
MPAVGILAGTGLAPLRGRAMHISVQRAAALLGVTDRQIYRWVDEGELPCERVRDQVRFNRTDLLEWATRRRLPVSLEAFDEGLDPEDRSPSLAEAIRAGGVHADVAGGVRDSVLREVVRRTPLPASLDPDFLFEVLVAREQTTSTAVGDGIAIPHVRHPIVAPGACSTVAVFYLRGPVDFASPDGQPITTLFFIVSPTVRTHLQMLAHLARALHDEAFRTAIVRRDGVDVLASEAARLELPVPALGPLATDDGPAD